MVDLSRFDLVNVYLTHTMQVDLDIEIFRSLAYDGQDTNYAVMMPGGSQTMLKQTNPLGGVSATDFNVSVAGHDTVWLKISPAAGNQIPGGGAIQDLAVMVK